VGDLVGGHKTGFYLDQRENRRLVSELAADRRTLDLFCYTGGFSVAAGAGGAGPITAVDSSAPSLALAATNLERNGIGGAELVEADVFTYLRELRDRGERFDLIVADPPKLARSTSQLKRATRAYKDLNLLALKLLAPGGLLVTCSCSGLVTEDLFQKVLFGAALDARRDAQIVDRLTQATDHPVLLSFPEAAYLKGLVLRVS
jgi:23S rRNA (cytosine1962-C5)-methyltransferase